ncbi:alpha/beta hydrolase [Xylophilus sp.]|uniref:alpha/beta hydrolase n=1 Tax=Xylophilus sp. TaxID=2653893 RepID=UPI0013BAD350|nr:alpha/beta hydrolase [Xylophilus sp.]KAF1049233.1 MAG: Carboxylesterase NlhH [Xylophilus sp.]
MSAPSSPSIDIAIALEGQGGAQIAARLYGRRVAAGGPLVLHFHGGTFTCGSLDDGAVVAQLLGAAGAVVVSLDYPLAPEHPFPQAVEAGYGALQWLHRQRTRLAGRASRLYLAGEEAGGNLAAAVALVARDRAHPPLAGQILVSPMLDPCAGTPSLREAQGAQTECKWAEGWKKYLRCPMDTHHPYAVPGASSRLAGLPPALILAGQDDLLRDEALAYAERLRGAGIAVDSGLLGPYTGWPEALTEPSDAPQRCPCADEVELRLRRFFGATGPAATPPRLPGDNPS